MDILGIGFPELLLILIIAMMIFGPRRLPEIAAKLGKFVSDLRNMSSGLMTEWQREITVATRLEELEKTRQEFNDIKEEIQQTRKSLAGEASSSMKELDKAREEVEKEVKSIPESASEESAAKIASPSNKPAGATSPPLTEETAEGVPSEELDKAGEEVEKEVESISESPSEDAPAKSPSPLEKPADSTAPTAPEEPDAPQTAASPAPPSNSNQSSKTQSQPASPSISPAEAVNE